MFAALEAQNTHYANFDALERFEGMVGKRCWIFYFGFSQNGVAPH